MAETTDVVVVGGGAVGSAIAYELAKAGASVALLEARRIAEEASGVAAGMLAPLVESSRPGPFADLLLAAVRSYPTLAPELWDVSGVDIEYVPSGVLRVAVNEEQEQTVRTAHKWQAGQGMELTWLGAQDVRVLEPALAPEVRGALFSPGEGHVRAARVTTAFAVGASRLGAVVRQGTQVTGLITEGRRVTGVRTLPGDISAGHVVVAAGPWTGALLSTIGIHLPVRPVKGQILSLVAMPSPLRRIIYGSGGIYLVPKPDGSIVVGATQEEAGFDHRVTLQGLHWLLDGAARLVPSLGNAEVRDLWTGLRPGSPDAMPILGQPPNWDGITVASGHFRNGILLSPLTGRLIAQLLTEGTPEIDLAPFSPVRFSDS